MGSTGVSIAIDKGVTTRVEVKKAARTRVLATFNGHRLSENSTSIFLAKKCAALDTRSQEIQIAHECPFPIGQGYGTSGAGALGLSMALNEALGLSLTQVETAQIAHVCEVACRTGLGTITSAFSGGLNYRLEPGAPGCGRVSKIPLAQPVAVVSASLGQISTPKILTSESVKNRINRCGKDLLTHFLRHRSVSNFMTLSRRFSECLGLMSQRLSAAIHSLEDEHFQSSMMMLGDSLFCVVADEMIVELVDSIRLMGLHPTVARVARVGAQLL